GRVAPPGPVAAPALRRLEDRGPGHELAGPAAPPHPHLRPALQLPRRLRPPRRGARQGAPVLVGRSAAQNTARGFAGEPVPPTTRSGAITSMKSSWPSSTQACA